MFVLVTLTHKTITKVKSSQSVCRAVDNFSLWIAYDGIIYEGIVMWVALPDHIIIFEIL